jgi:hypothetical protein
MSRLFFQLRNETENLLDLEGVELLDLKAAKQQARRCAYGIMASDVSEGKLNLNYRIEVENEVGRVIYIARFRDLVEIIGLEAN